VLSHGKFLRNCDVFAEEGVLLVAIKRGDFFQFGPAIDTITKTGNTLAVIGDPEQNQSVRAALNYR